ncbi:MAG: sensor histidine kinase, partial [Pseudobdellovibrionaceae bacterium]
EERHKMLVHQKELEAAQALAKQVSHDIRSPLTALNMVVSLLKNTPEEMRLLMKNATQRINDIANTLLEKSQATAAPTVANGPDPVPVHSKLKSTLIAPLIDSLVSEKRMEYRTSSMVDIEADSNKSYGGFAKIDPVEFKRVLSNLINNSVEAFDASEGKIIVALRKYAQNIEVIVSDNGKGIPAHILQKIGEKGFSFGKENSSSGSGLGVHHAKHTIESFGGTFSILSQQNQGTQIRMSLPLVEPPDWFAESIAIPKGTSVVCIDDDLSIHNLWNNRLQKYLDEKDVKSLHQWTSVEDFKKSFQPHTSTLYLVDYDFLNQSQNGLQLISKLGIAKNSILVTNQYYESQIQNEALKLGLKILPKSMAVSIGIDIVDSLK